MTNLWKFQQLVPQLPRILRYVCLQVFFWTVWQYHSICMFGFGFCSFFGHYPASTSVW